MYYTLNLTLKLWFPQTLARIAVFFLLLYRKLRYSYPFRKISLGQGYYAIVDPDDYPMLIQYKWYKICSDGIFYASNIEKINGKMVNRKMHRLIMASQLEAAEKLALHSPQGGVGSELPNSTNSELNSKLKIQNLALHSPQGDVGSKFTNLRSKLVIDHINHNGLDNRKANLRVVTPRQNSWNRKYKTNTARSSRFIGVSWRKCMSKWQARIMVDDKILFLGYFDNETEAARVYDQAVIKYRGNYGQLNFPQDK